MSDPAINEKMNEVVQKLGSLYVCEQQGNDAEGRGTEKMPYQSLLKAVTAAKGEPKAYDIFIRKAILDNYELAAKSATKKVVNTYLAEQKKAAKAAERALQDKENAEKNRAAEEAKLEHAKTIVISEDKSLPAAKFIKLRDAEKYRDVRVKVSGWIHRIRVQGKDMMFVVLRDGYGFIQTVMTGQMCHTYNALTLSRESTISVYGIIKELPAGKTVY